MAMISIAPCQVKGYRKGFKIFQGGMIVGGTEGLKVIEEGISRGSRDYEIVVKLLERGAILQATEDLSLLKKEYTYIRKMAGAKSQKERELWALRYKQVQGRLLAQRDDFIARRIAEGLDEGESGILFIGAHHDVLSRLPADIQVTRVKASIRTGQGPI